MLNLRAARYSGMESLPAAYAPLFDAASAGNLFLSRSWFVNFEQNVLRAQEKAQIYGVEQADRQPNAVGALVMRSSRAGTGPWAPRQLEGLANYYTSFFGPLLYESAGQGDVLRRLAAALWEDRSRWDVLHLHPLDVEAPAFAELVDALRSQGAIVQTYFCFGNWYLDVAGRTYSEYLGGLSSTLRKNIPYYGRKLERTAEARIEIVTGGETLDQALLAYEKVYGASWKIPEPYPNFIRGLVRRAAENGWLRMGLVHIGDEPAAAQIWFVHGGTASIFKLAYDERFKKLSVGTVLTAKVMERVIDGDRVRCVDYLSGDDAYKKEWMSHRRERWGIVAFNPRSVRGAWQAVRNVGGRRAKALLRWIADRRRGSATPAQE